MRRRYRREREDVEDDLIRGIFAFVFLGVLYFAFLYYTNRAEFWQWALYGAAALAVVMAVVMLFVWTRAGLRKRRQERVLSLIQSADLGREIRNFVESFGRNEKSKNAFEYRGYSIDWHRINELRDDFARRGVELTPKEFVSQLRQHIDDREQRITLASAKSQTYDLNTQSGSEFERLLGRLYEKMGYTVRLTGGTGDQGGDLVAIKGGESILIQAKRYGNGSVGNAAVQQAVAARKMYNCNKAAVVTTSEFTREAVDLAKVNDVELISRPRLQQMLDEHLSENWR